ncbi:hemerythrin domain-containing protein [Micromonospora rifamycinica]|uniref:Hemerythrin HHE cation binding domain-containing protein n=1 Tax=Micromonospora rifamycinica TaxID=291594 RepID=A0A109IIG9_9ACTN|nr:hemerythrin domain-containing protein [Micromonospora rifamycinica]KWV31149.1 hemerythrin [Micromonospora rifamycinica]SCG66077.1 Hemerythrin HHE cation binding domain-containing protein [Micromonospora rifamycinica]
MSNAQAGTEQDVVDVLTADHHEIATILVELESRQGSAEHRRRLADVLIAELVRHAVAEEMYVYPAARRALPDGDQLAEHEIAEHAAAERTLKELEPLDPSSARFEPLISHLTKTIRHHVREEEAELFPRLRAAVAHEELVELAERVQAAKRHLPTRPHPGTPDHPPANRLLHPGAGLVDRIRDALSGRPTTLAELADPQDSELADPRG